MYFSALEDTWKGIEISPSPLPFTPRIHSKTTHRPPLSMPNSSTFYKMQLRNHTGKKAAAKLAGLRPKGQNRLGAIGRTATPTNVSKQPQKIHFSGSLPESEDVDMHDNGDSDNVAGDDDKVGLSPIPKKASRAADKASSGARRKVTRAPFTPEAGPSRVIHSTPRKRRQSRNPPKVSIIGSTVLSTPTRLPRLAERHDAQVSIKHGDLPAYHGTPSRKRKPVSQMRPHVYPPPIDPYEEMRNMDIQNRELKRLQNDKKMKDENQRFMEELLEQNPNFFDREESVRADGKHIRRFGSHGTELDDSDNEKPQFFQFQEVGYTPMYLNRHPPIPR